MIRDDSNQFPKNQRLPAQKASRLYEINCQNPQDGFVGAYPFRALRNG